MDEPTKLTSKATETTAAPETRRGIGDSGRRASSGVFDVRMITYIAMTVALAAVLNYLPLFKMPQGGSVSLDMLPIVFLAFYRGARPAVLAGLIYGLVDLALDPYIAHPVQVVLDYPLAFGLVGLAGITGGRGPIAIALGTLLGGLLRFTAHFFSGVIFFGSYAPEGQSVWLYSAVYNGSYISISILLCIPMVYVLLRAMGTEGARRH